MSENISPNMRKINRKSKAVNYSIEKYLIKTETIESKVKKIKTNDNKEEIAEMKTSENPRIVCIDIDSDPEVIDNTWIEDIETTSHSITNNTVSESIDKTEEIDIESPLIEDCLKTECQVFAEMTTEEMAKLHKEMGLKVNEYIECIDIESDDESDNECQSKVKSKGLEYIVEYIEGSAVDEINRVVYNVKWKYFDRQQNTWEPLNNLLNCIPLVNEFKFINNSRNDDKDKQMMTYRHFYALKGILEDIVEKKCHFDIVLTVLLIFNDCGLKDYNYTKVQCFNWKNDLRDSVLKRMDDISKIKKMASRLEQMAKVFNTTVKSLNILKKFTEVENFFKFFEKLKLTQTKLVKWENDINHIITNEGEGTKIKLENYVDLEVPPVNFEYITKSKANDTEIIINNDPPVYCDCNECEDNQNCCVFVNTEQSIVYSKNGILKDIRNNKTAIYECNKKCKCSTKCTNRVIQNGRKHRLAIFRTDDGKGWGVRALERIPRGSFVMEYIGEMITVEEADIRGRKYDAEGRTYLFDLDYTPEEEQDIHKYTIDATQCGNISHFVNHSCDPNLDTRVAWINNLDPFMPHIALFAVRDIRLNEELSFDYKINVHGISDLEENNNTIEELNSFDSGICQMADSLADLSKVSESKPKKPTRVECMCGAKNCKKYLY